MRLTKLLAGATAVSMLALSIAVIPQPAAASSHREAPLISRDPLADNTDLYAFRSPDKPDTVTIIANYIPLEEPNGGPNFATFSDDVRYEIHIDNNRNADEDITYRFRFKTTIQNPDSFLYATGPITSPTDPNYNQQQTYTVEKKINSTTTMIGSGVVPPVNVGPRSTPNYDAIAAQAITTLGDGSTVFAGQRDDPFFVDLGSIFDLGGLRPFNGAHLLPLPTENGIDGVSGYNTHSIVLQIPISKLTVDGKIASETGQPVLGIYASASRQKTTVLRDKGRVSTSGSWVQVSRLGNPLINEVIIPVGRKDEWNATEPKNDSKFESYYLKPELAGIVNLVYPSLPDARTTGRTDLSLILLTGIPGVNFSGSTKADLLRLNVSIMPSAPVGQGNPLTVITTSASASPDLAGFPNGRRLEDDVTDIELRAVADGYGFALNSLFGLPNNSPNNIVGDGVNANDKAFSTTFPYVASPFAGYDSGLHR